MSYFPLNTRNLTLGAEQLDQMSQFKRNKSYRYVYGSPRENVGWQGEYSGQYKTIHVISYNYVVKLQMLFTDFKNTPFTEYHYFLLYEWLT